MDGLPVRYLVCRVCVAGTVVAVGGAALVRRAVLILRPVGVLRGEAQRLNEYVQHFEGLSYSTHDVHQNHLRAKRSVTRENAVQLQFKSHGRRFHLRLKRDLETFHDDVQVVDGAGERQDVDLSHIYTGHILGEPGSHVFGSITNGVFHGRIISPHDGDFYVEKAHYYFPKESNNTFHSVIYHSKDITDPYAERRTGHSSGCGVTDHWMEQVQNSFVSENEDDVPKRNLKKVTNQSDKKKVLPKRNIREPPPSQKPTDTFSNYEYEYPYDKYSREMNDHNRRKRATQTNDEKKNTCSLFIQTDPLIWRHIRDQVGNNSEKIREEILSLIAHHVTAVNYIYRDTKFDGRMEHRNIKFEVQRIKIDNDSQCDRPYAGESNPFCMENIDVSNFLNLHSLGNHEVFCLAYVFTYRDFTGGTLGLAWVASASGASGGICEKHKMYTETVGGTYQSTKRSLNTGIITFVNYNSRVPPKVSQLTLAHEIGHNFGSPHDYPLQCRPGGLSGNYIMFASATSGDRPNNSRFSNCSVANISHVLDAIFENKKKNCFKESEGAFCGNKIVEDGEECDCGFDNECTDPCCYPRNFSEHDHNLNKSAVMCARRANTQCSPSQGPCCSADTCSFIPSSFNQECRSETNCSWRSLCDGRSAECPEPSHKQNKTRCNEGTQLCINGECSGSICLEWNMTECFLTSTLIPNIDKRQLCVLACQNGTDPNSCRSTSEFAHKVGLKPGGISLRPGSPCDNFQGYCDVFFKCRAVDAEGPLARLKNMLFNKQTLQTLAQWVTEYWWAVLLMGIFFIIFMAIFIKCCAVHTPSSNPKKPPARRFSETLRRPMNTLRRMPRRPRQVTAEQTMVSFMQEHTIAQDLDLLRVMPMPMPSRCVTTKSDRTTKSCCSSHSHHRQAGQVYDALNSGNHFLVAPAMDLSANQSLDDVSPKESSSLHALLCAPAKCCQK
ncbi:disintegrin and metalloproteinase domain-containing protein 10 isoform X1 [Frankliniella occidentalis]|uniref:ADAM10 endopeptidase n=1 Tax=Frankliniella occidentalis TaxID=133901 RepID=A0A9C6X9S4_FRAOC|nr:disintegrin and metalloproteinase domain-containing protein 10 isoform X1 [Frankliniella occidentalis]